jgi:membrane associated rhomboid family serine protease
MFVFFSFGSTVEKVIMPVLAGSSEEPNQALGSIYYIILYTGAIYASSLTEYFKNRNNQHYTSLGASGAVNAVVFSYILCLPKDTLSIFFIPNIPAWIFGLLYLGISYYLSKRKLENDNVGHEAHFWGAVFGLIFTGILKPDLFSNFIRQIL